MKRLLYIGIAFVALSSCKKFLDQVPNDRLTEEETFNSWATGQKFLNNIYSKVPDEYGQRDGGRYASSDNYNNGGIWTGGSDEAEFLWDFVRSNFLNIGSWDASSDFVKTYWTNYYAGIRNAGIFIENAHKMQDLQPELITQYKAEARALRAIYYFQLVRIYGPVVLLGDKIIKPDENLQIPRSSIDECIEYITTELAAAAGELPTVPNSDQDYGRITKGIALAYRAQALLYAASPLFNGNTDYANLKNKDGKQLIPQTVDANKWKLAANAYKEFIATFVPGTYDLYRENDANGYSPYLSCRNVMLKDWNSEVIFSRRASLESRQYELCPRHDGQNGDIRGGTGLAATQKMVDAFFMANGQSPVTGYNADGTPIVNGASGYQLTGFTSFKAPSSDPTATARNTYNQWVDREPRFYVNITYNRSVWINTNFGKIETTLFYNGNSGKGPGKGDYSVTGYVVRKAMGTGKWNINDHKLVLIRLAEIYLSYAECLNEADYGGNLTETLKYLNLIRERAGIPQYGTGVNALPVPANQDEMREAIRKERRVELAFENSRFFDVRRWKIAEQTENGPAWGLNTDSGEPGFYDLKSFETRVFNKKHYLFPIPQVEIINDLQLVQNTGWQN
ncbi:RagB/SusD family nutrient uptake outer membrane protein [Pseudoflavitalea sp. X16]|uniref:RagB/SusD family nutrient uptake outer membrane protein n=1 Tax=Paraflavitalea devenefica TaxID=2716334 RepID=UPI0014226DC9|nr:RagB/SusD family nutrient uptake outer membrane protein [Paraflavitalea devenefica]NII26077.1 RagB/SusD family nutrient uptake outer membrane protein [Paraflavitalea devenefica]